MDDFTLTMNCGYPSQDIIVGGESGTDFDFISPVPDISEIVSEEVILDEDIDAGATSSSEDGSGSPCSTGSPDPPERIIEVSFRAYWKERKQFAKRSF